MSRADRAHSASAYGRGRNARNVIDSRRSLDVALRRPERMKNAVRSPAFRPQAFGATEWICVRRLRPKGGTTNCFSEENSGILRIKNRLIIYLLGAALLAPSFSVHA